MIKPITKEYFYKLSGPIEKLEKRVILLEQVSYDFNVELRLDKDSEKDCVGKYSKKDYGFAVTSAYLYFEKPGEGAFVYIEPLNLALIPEKYKEMSIVPSEEIDFSDWELKKLSDTPNKMYTKNAVSYASSYIDTCYIAKDYLDKISGGEYRIENARIGFSTEISIITSHTWRSFDIAHPKKLEMPVNMPEIEKIDKNLYNMLVWTQKKQ